MARIHFFITIAAFALSSVAAYHRPDLPESPYCSIIGCCKGRQENCSFPLDNSRTLCYCDEFCNRTRPAFSFYAPIPYANDDCCPDYEAVCLHMSTPPPVALPIIKGKCMLNTKKTEKCNTCYCELINDEPDWRCETEKCLMSDDVTIGVKADRATWRATIYSNNEKQKLKDALKYRLGTLQPSKATLRMSAIRYEKDLEYPTQFDAEKRWPGFITSIRDQGWCGSDWAVSIASIASDRFAILSNGAERVELSPQTLLSCKTKDRSRRQQDCEGGHVDVAWNYVRKYGLLEESCFPYQQKEVPCPYKKRGKVIMANCQTHSNMTKAAGYRVSPVYRLGTEKDIMYELMQNGPVQAMMTVYQDFFHYKDGIYRHTRHGDQYLQGLHSVKIVGWGEHDRVKYWKVANSWGPNWGERGYFRIARGINESGIESFVVAALSEVNVANMKK